MKKTIFLVDMNAFFIGCEMVRNSTLRGKPSAVAGDPKNRSGIILAANYEARKFGVRTAMVLHEALRLCPDLQTVPPDHEYYEKTSAEVMRLLQGFTPELQQNSIDEAWLDVTGCESLFGPPGVMASTIMDKIMHKLGLWCSIGISENKFLAKMASELKKPLGITTLWKDEVDKKLWPLGVRDMYGIGKQTERKLQVLNILTIGDLAHSSPALLSSAFGKYGLELHRLANGVDESPVEACPSHDSKSISRSTTLPQDLIHLEDAKKIMLMLSEEVGMDARRQELKGRTVSITIRYNDFHTFTRQRSVAPTHLTKDIYRMSMQLLEENWKPSRPVRLLGVGLSHFDDLEVEQLSLFDVIEAQSGTQKQEALEQTMDTLRNKFGVDKIKRAQSI